MSLFDDGTSRAALRGAFDVCVRHGAGPGSDGVTVADFARRAEHELGALHDELSSGAWRPRPARVLRIPKAGGGYRQLALSCVRDRVVQHALATTLSSALDDVLHPCAYAWRRGRSATQALAAVEASLRAGQEWAFRGDIEEFFDRIPHGMVLAALEAVTAEPPLVALVGRLLEAGSLVGGQVLDPSLGAGQGSALSPFLANLYLLPFDRAVEAAGFQMVRYGDDLCIAAVARTDAERARAVVERALASLRLALNATKVLVRHVGEGFAFLGYHFDAMGRRPSAKARRELSRRLDEIASAPDGERDAAADATLRGWATYYGSLAGVDLPEALRARAEVVEAARAEAAQLSRATGRPRAVDRPQGDGRASAVGPTEASVWQSAAIRLAGARGSADEGAVEASLRASLGVTPEAWEPIAAALARFDGAAVAEALAAQGRFGEAGEAAAIQRPPEAPAPRGAAVAVVREDGDEPPRFSPEPRDAERLLELFGGCEGAYLRDARIGDRVERERVMRAAGAEQARAHLAGTWWLGVYPLRGNHTVRFAAVRVVVAARARQGLLRAQLPPAVDGDARRVADAVRAHGLEPVHSVEPGRARVVWVLFAEAIAAARARTLVALVLERAGAAGPDITREVVPAQDSTRPDKPGTGVLLPLGLDPRTGERAWLCDEALVPVIDPCAYLRALRGATAAQVAAAVGISPRLPPLGAKAPPPQAPWSSPAARPPPSKTAAPSPESPPAEERAAARVAADTSPFRELPRAQEVYAGCNVLRHYVDEAIAGRGMPTSARLLVAEVLGRLGDESTPALDAVLRHLDDWRPGLASRHLQRLYPYPTSCGRIRTRLPELTARVGCDCRFRVPPGAYPTPVLHAVGAAEVPGLAERVRASAERGGLARAAVAAMNEGRKELGAKASALCARLADLRRQGRVIERTIASVEAELDAVLDEVGDEPLETPSGTLRRVVEGGARRFVLDV